VCIVRHLLKLFEGVICRYCLFLPAVVSFWPFSWSDQDYSGLSSYPWPLFAGCPHCFLLYDEVLGELIGPFFALMSAIFSLHVLDHSLQLYTEDMILFWCFPCLRAPCTMSFLGIPLVCFARLYILYYQAYLLYGFSHSFILRCELIYLIFHGRDTLVLLWYLGSCFRPYTLYENLSPFNSCPHSWAGMPVVWLCSSTWHSARSIGLLLVVGWEEPARALVGGFLYCSFFHAIHRTSQTRIFQKALHSRAHARLYECSTRTRTCANARLRERTEMSERSEVPG